MIRLKIIRINYNNNEDVMLSRLNTEENTYKETALEFMNALSTSGWIEMFKSF
jgi:hypothetical protein